jgi:hypothetical protein
MDMHIYIYIYIYIFPLSECGQSVKLSYHVQLVQSILEPCGVMFEYRRNFAKKYEMTASVV